MPRRPREIDSDRLARRQKRRLELLDAALVAIRREGPTVSMEVIAAEAGVTKPIVYKHFGDRSGLAAAIGEQFGTELVEALQRALDRTDLEPEALLRATIDTYLEFIEREPQLYRFMVSTVAPTDGGIGQAALVLAVGQRVAVVLGEQLRATGRDSGPAEAWAFGIVGMVHHAGDWWLDRRTLTRDRLADYLSSLLWHGLAWAGDGPKVSDR
jgi:AcrR family transcriptional regulator